jgi:DNA-directed RNA polymerase specialized sigma subunit
MTAKEFLRRARGIDRRVDEATERVMRLRARLEAGRMAQISDMPRGGNSDWTETANALIDLEKDMNAKIREMVKVKRLAMEAIEAVEEIRYREVLELYYLNGYTWEKVAEQMGYDVRHITRLHGKALLKVKVPEKCP